MSQTGDILWLYLVHLFFDTSWLQDLVAREKSPHIPSGDWPCTHSGCSTADGPQPVSQRDTDDVAPARADTGQLDLGILFFAGLDLGRILVASG